MTIDEAIKKLEGLINYPQYPVGSEDTPAIKLGIEALKVFQRRRKSHAVTMTGLLPGETKE